MNNRNLAAGSVVSHPEYGTGVIIQVKSETYIIRFIKYGISEIMKDFPDLDIIDKMESPEDFISYEEIEKSLTKILRKFSDIQETVPIGDRWRGGTLILKPGREDLQSKEIPIDSFFHKIVMVRDRLRVLEQNINKSNLNDDEKVNIQQYITRVYGSLTTFNVLFKFKEDSFKGSGK